MTWLSKIPFLVRPSVSRMREAEILNEAVNFEKECIFVAIPKTGTTSVRSQMRQKGVPLIRNPHLSIVQIRDSIYVYLLSRTLGRNELFPSESVPTDMDLRLHAREIFDGFFKFSAVRNPWARAVSLYFRREGVQIRSLMSFEQFVERHLYASDTCRQPTRHKNQFDWLCDETGSCLMDYVYKLEEFEKEIARIAEITGGKVVLQAKSSNFNPGSKSRSYRDMYSDKTRRMIAVAFEKDIDMFKYSF